MKDNLSNIFKFTFVGNEFGHLQLLSDGNLTEEDCDELIKEIQLKKQILERLKEYGLYHRNIYDESIYED